MPPHRPRRRTGPDWSSALAAAAILATPALAAGQARVAAAGGAVSAGAELQAGDAAWARGARDSAAAFYAIVVGRDSSAAPRAVARLAAVEADRNRLAQALTLHRLYVRLVPGDADGYTALGRTQSWAGQYREAVASYDSALARDPSSRDAALGQAQTLAWASRFAPALAAYERWLAAHPLDDQAALAQARTLAWAGRLDEAERAYARVAARGPSADAEKGVARVAAWRGDLARSERLWRDLTRRDPSDAEAWTGLAQVLRWTDRPGLAADALRTALAARPNYEEAQAQLRWVDADLAGSAEPLALLTTDSDGNRAAYYAGTASARPPWPGRVLITGSFRSAEFQTTHGQALGVRAVASRSVLGGQGTVRAELGATHLTRDTAGVPLAGATQVVVGVRATGQPRRGVTIGAGAARAPFDETATLIARGVYTTTIDGDVSVALPKRIAFAAGIGHAVMAGGTVPNARLGGSASLRYALRRRLWVGAAARQFGYDRSGRADGYFSPASFLLVEGNARAEIGKDLGWGASLDGGVGRQTIRFEAGDAVSSNLAGRVAASVVYRVAPGTELGAAYGFANVAAAGALSAAEYRAHTVSLRARLKL